MPKLHVFKIIHTAAKIASKVEEYIIIFVVINILSVWIVLPHSNRIINLEFLSKANEISVNSDSRLIAIKREIVKTC